MSVDFQGFIWSINDGSVNMGKLKTDGRYLQYPLHGNPGNRTMANLYLTLLDAAGAPRPTFGVTDPNMDPKDQKGPLTELLA